MIEHPVALGVVMNQSEDHSQFRKSSLPPVKLAWWGVVGILAKLASRSSADDNCPDGMSILKDALVDLMTTEVRRQRHDEGWEQAAKNR